MESYGPVLSATASALWALYDDITWLQRTSNAPNLVHKKYLYPSKLAMHHHMNA